MAEKELGHNDEIALKPHMRQLLPTFYEVLLYFVFSLVIVVYANHRLLFTIITQSTNSQGASLSSAFSFRFEFIKSLVNNNKTSGVALALFWAIIGSFAYIVVWFLQNLYYRLREDIVSASNAARFSMVKKYWESAFSRYILLLSSLFAFVIYLAFLILFALPYSLTLSNITLSNFHSSYTYPYLIIATLIIMMLLYIGTRLLYAISHIFGSYFSK